LTYFIRIVLISFLFIQTSNSFGQPPVGHWTFEPGEEFTDRSENFDPIQLKNAEIKNGCLFLDSARYAYTLGYSGPNIDADKTLITWLYLDDLEALSGITVSIEAYGNDFLDAITYHGLYTEKWSIGSDNWNRSNVNDHGAIETDTVNLIQIAATYKSISDDSIRITLYRNGELYDSYNSAKSDVYYTGSTHVKFGYYGNTTTDAYIWIHCRVEEARIYNRALSQEEIRNLKIVKTSTYKWLYWLIGGLLFVIIAVILFRKLKYEKTQ
jgi:hypothetical protein